MNWSARYLMAHLPFGFYPNRGPARGRLICPCDTRAIGTALARLRNTRSTPVSLTPTRSAVAVSPRVHVEVVPSVRMTRGARLFRVTVERTALLVLTLRAGVEVRGVHAPPVPAQMVEGHPFWNRSDPEFVCKAVGAHHRAAQAELAVPIHPRGGPPPACAGLAHLLYEAGFRVHGLSSAHCATTKPPRWPRAWCRSGPSPATSSRSCTRRRTACWPGSPTRRSSQTRR